MRHPASAAMRSRPARPHWLAPARGWIGRLVHARQFARDLLRRPAAAQAVDDRAPQRRLRVRVQLAPTGAGGATALLQSWPCQGKIWMGQPFQGIIVVAGWLNFLSVSVELGFFPNSDSAASAAAMGVHAAEYAFQWHQLIADQPPVALTEFAEKVVPAAADATVGKQVFEHDKTHLAFRRKDDGAAPVVREARPVRARRHMHCLGSVAITVN